MHEFIYDPRLGKHMKSGVDEHDVHVHWQYTAGKTMDARYEDTLQITDDLGRAKPHTPALRAIAYLGPRFD